MVLVCAVRLLRETIRGNSTDLVGQLVVGQSVDHFVSQSVS
jgi:hypothetical protein